MDSPKGFEGFIEIAPHFRPRKKIRYILFDFDGTLSLIRQGWPEVMLPLFVEMLPRRGGESSEEIRGLLYDDIMRLNGKQTIYQMIQLADRIKERGGAPKDPLWYKREYLRRLDQRIQSRIRQIEHHEAAPDQFLVYGARDLLKQLDARHLPMYLASGTDEVFVKRETELLEVTRYFGDRVFGAQDDFRLFSKKRIIDRILREHKIAGEELLAFGDGYVEIQNTKEVGGVAVAVASDEARNGSGRVDAWKRERLLGVGADIVIADYRDSAALIDLILAKT